MSLGPVRVPAGMTTTAASAISDPTPGEAPIYRLVEKCRKAILEYDRSWDHCSHGPGADCVRCNVAAAVWAAGAPSAVSRRYPGPDLVLGEAISILHGMAGGQRAYDPISLFRACDTVRRSMPDTETLLHAAARSIAEAAAVRAFAVAHFEAGGAAYCEAMNVATEKLSGVRDFVAFAQKRDWRP